MASMPYRTDSARASAHWAAEATTHQREVAEAALSHVSGDSVERSYQRGDLFEKRRHLMNDWARFVSKTQHAKVVAIRITRGDEEAGIGRTPPCPITRPRAAFFSPADVVRTLHVASARRG